MSNKILELYGHPTTRRASARWKQVATKQHCPYLARACLKVRKSQPDKSIGTCIVSHGKDSRPIIICPHRLLERRQIFMDCLSLLTLHEPGNELHVVPEVTIPGGSVDYFLVSARDQKVMDFIGIELQTLDTTGTVWPERQRFLRSVGIKVRRQDADSTKPFGMNWKMTAKTILMQLHHKVETFEHLGKHLILVHQDLLLGYMQREFSFDHLSEARLGDPMHFHTYRLDATKAGLRLRLTTRLSTDAAGIASALGLQVSANVELEGIIKVLESKMSDATLLKL